MEQCSFMSVQRTRPVQSSRDIALRATWRRGLIPVSLGYIEAVCIMLFDVESKVFHELLRCNWIPGNDIKRIRL